MPPLDQPFESRRTFNSRRAPLLVILKVNAHHPSMKKELDMYKKLIIQENTVAFYFVGGRFNKILEAGSHWIKAKSDVKTVLLDQPQLTFLEAESIANRSELAKDILVVKVKDGERAIIRKNGLMYQVLVPGMYYYLNRNQNIEVDLIDITENIDINDRDVRTLYRLTNPENFVSVMNVAEGCKALLYIDNVAKTELDPGCYYYWKTEKTVRVKIVDMRQQNIEITGQELMTKDKVTLRINLSASYKVSDWKKVAEEQVNFKETFYRKLQMALRQMVATRSLDQLLALKNEVSEEICEAVRASAKEDGVDLLSAGIRDIILPGEMKNILNRVIEAEKKAVANMIERREETAATRSLLNTAKLMENNPILLKLKELEAAEKMADKVDSITVNGGITQLFEALKAKNVL